VSDNLDFPDLSSTVPSPSRKQQQQQQRQAALPHIVPAPGVGAAPQSPKTPTKRQQQQQQQQHAQSPQRSAGSPRTPDRRAQLAGSSGSGSSNSSSAPSSASKARPAASPHKASSSPLLDDFDQFFVGTASLIHDIDSATTTKHRAAAERLFTNAKRGAATERVLVVLREAGVPSGTKYFGVLRSFDQFCESGRVVFGSDACF
jgi:hypothetical protein